MWCILSYSGVQRQLTYLQGSGCFNFWARGECSLWLTAMTTLVFSRLHQSESKDINTYIPTEGGRSCLYQILKVNISQIVTFIINVFTTIPSFSSLKIFLIWACLKVLVLLMKQ